MIKVLLTGFEPNDDGMNASEVVVNTLREKSLLALTEGAVELHCQILPVIRTGSEQR